jgi:serine/threonine protein kinase/formylglycine-generating enzyme required for sulfatase activity
MRVMARGEPKSPGETPGKRIKASEEPTVIAAAGAVVTAPESYQGTMGFDEAVVSSREIPSVTDPERYLPVRELGRGGMGRVDVVFDRVLGRKVAQKRVLQDRYHKFLVSEAQVGAQLEHPSIVPVYDIGSDAQDRPYYTMRVVNGRTLGDVIDGHFDPERSDVLLSKLLGILRQVCLAVDYANSRGVVHRDLKPDNIIVGEFGEVYVLDWGVACVADDSDIRQGERLPGAEAVAGTPGYMAPEQALGDAIDGRTDVYALGVILFEILTGNIPFDDDNLFSVVRRAKRPKTEDPKGLDERADELPPVFVELVRACLRRNKKKRPDSARAIADTIDRHLDAERAHAEREQEANARVSEAEEALREHAEMAEQAAVLSRESETLLVSLRSFEPSSAKKSAWAMEERARRMQSRAAKAFARAETAFARALGRVPHHVAARRGLARLYYTEFLGAEARGDGDRMAQQLELARSYDDGELALELADQGELFVECDFDSADIVVQRFEPAGPLLELAGKTQLSVASTDAAVLSSGSYCVTARVGQREVRYPLVIERAQCHRISLQPRGLAALPEGVVLIPGGPFLSRPQPSAPAVRVALPDYAIAIFPVTLREYIAFLEELDDEECGRRLPVVDGAPAVERARGSWSLGEQVIEGKGAERVSPEYVLDIPVFGVSWQDAVAYARWQSLLAGRSYRLPTALEWEKAMRGADGRPFPMGTQLDPSFAKIRSSRPEETQLEPVGAFDSDRSPFGVRDMAGGVCDWTSTMIGGDSPAAPDCEGTVDERRALYMGGHWGATTAPRGPHEMAIKRRSHAVGFRLAMDVDTDESSELIVTPMKAQ